MALVPTELPPPPPEEKEDLASPVRAPAGGGGGGGGGGGARRRATSDKKLQPHVTIADNPAEIFAVSWSPDGRYLATGSGDGSLRVFQGDTGRVAFELQHGSSAALPATALKFRPANEALRTKNVVVCTNAVGAVQHWHITSGKCLHTIEEVDNQIFALDYRPDGLMFATGGKDAAIRLYDEATKAVEGTMRGGSGYGPHSSAGHSNRIFSIRFHPTDENLVVSGGWDNTIQLWDRRIGHSVQSIYGPHLCGDALDISVDGAGRTTILTGSWRPENPLELWDLTAGECVEQVQWQESLLGSQPCLLYAAQFSKAQESKARFIAAGGSGANEARIFDRKVGLQTGETALVGTVAGLERGVFTVDWSPNQDRVAVGAGDGSIRILDVVDRD